MLANFAVVVAVVISWNGALGDRADAADAPVARLGDMAAIGQVAQSFAGAHQATLAIHSPVRESGGVTLGVNRSRLGDPGLEEGR